MPKKPEDEGEALARLSEDIGALVPAYTGYQLAHRVISLLCEQLGIQANELTAIKDGKARIVRYRKG